MNMHRMPVSSSHLCQRADQLTMICCAMAGSDGNIATAGRAIISATAGARTFKELLNQENWVGSFSSALGNYDKNTCGNSD